MGSNPPGPDQTQRFSAFLPPSPDVDRVELARRISHLQALHRVGTALTSSMEAGEIGQLLLREFCFLVGASSAVFWYLDRDTRRLMPSLTIGDVGALRSLSVDTDDDLPVITAKTATPHQVLRRSTPSPDARPHEPACRVCIPLVAQSEALGVVDLRTVRTRPVEPDVEEMLATMASQAAVLIRSADARHELAQSYRELAVLHEIQQEISSTVEYHKILTIIVDRLKRLFDAAEVTIRLVEEREGNKVVRVAATTGRLFVGKDIIPFEEATLDHRVMNGDLLAMDDVRTDDKFPERADAAKAGVVTMLTAPLIARSRVIGTIRLYTAERREFSVTDRKMLLAVAGMAATAIDHARLYRQVEAKNRELMVSYESLRDAQKELLKKERLAVLGKMAATVAHEVRNPLTSVRGFAQRISRVAARLGDPRLSEYTGIIMEEVDRLNRLLKDVLDFGRDVRASLALTNLNSVVKEAIGLVHDELASAQIAVVLDLAPALPDMQLDGTMMRNALLNLIHNARQAMPGGGALLIKTQDRSGAIRLRIADTGVGIPRQDLRRIWEPFVTTKLHGSGLGLPVVLKAIDAHQGHISVHSKVGKGTIFDMLFPILPADDPLIALDRISQDNHRRDSVAMVPDTDPIK